MLTQFDEKARLTKRRIRSKILLKLKIQKEENRDRKSRALKAKLLRTKVFKKAKAIMFYISLGGEPDTSGMITAARSLGKIVMVPVCMKNKILIRPCLLEDSAKLRVGPYGIREPALERPVPLDNLDLVIVPGVAFDKKGNRLGRGKGYYDRFLAILSPKTATIGLAFDFQILPSVPVQAHDVSVGKVLFA
ncbi:MAG: 5-formyltetrahydrofolate cyclo-ligase [Candidatus Omnitrophota bacterium]|nr:5-formyltetrahydrofolate cyclo-ligase [Candidatus Omnitrophota bacterium]